MSSYMAEDTAVSTKSGGNSRDTTGSMRLLPAGGPAARAGFAAAADTAEDDKPFFLGGYRGILHPPSDDEGTERTLSDHSMASKMSTLMDHL